MARILVTGAGGFVGHHLVPRLVAAGHDVVTAGRARPNASMGDGVTHNVVGDIGPHTDWARALEGCQTVVHLAAQVPSRGVPAGRFDVVNDEGTDRLTRQATVAGVERFILLSSVLAALPEEIEGYVIATSYGSSKRAAEAHVEAFSGTDRVGLALRAPLVYGAGAAGNWGMLTRIASLPLPLPFGSVHNRRSVVAVENLTDAVCTAAVSGRASSGVFAVTDSDTVSLAEIVTWLRCGMGRRAGLLKVPRDLLFGALGLIGQNQIAQSLLGDLVADGRPFNRRFNWRPLLQSKVAITAAGAAFAAMR